MWIHSARHQRGSLLKPGLSALGQRFMRFRWRGVRLDKFQVSVDQRETALCAMVVRIDFKYMMQTDCSFLPIEIFDGRIGIVAIPFDHVVGGAKKACMNARSETLGGRQFA